tara:strand:+ start:432 stop:773 length:342 start_codon:yes stop_codon:yes gene_type:complete
VGISDGKVVYSYIGGKHMEPEPKDDKGLTETEEWELERKLIDLAFYNSYVILTNKLTYEEFALSNHKKGISSVIFHDPHEGPSSEDIKDMIDYYSKLEEYEICHELQKVHVVI